MINLKKLIPLSFLIILNSCSHNTITHQPGNGSQTEQPVNGSQTQQPANGSQTEQPVNGSQTPQTANDAQTQQPANGSQTQESGMKSATYPYVGLENNPCNSCFMNSLIQSIKCINAFDNKLKNIPTVQEILNAYESKSLGISSPSEMRDLKEKIILNFYGDESLGKQNDPIQFFEDPKINFLPDEVLTNLDSNKNLDNQEKPNFPYPSNTENRLVYFIHLERSVFGAPNSVKNLANIDIPNTINRNNKVYTLKAAILHHGSNFNSGHYTATCKHDSNTFYEMNDSSVTKITETQTNYFKNSTPSLLFYVQEQ